MIEKKFIFSCQIWSPIEFFSSLKKKFCFCSFKTEYSNSISGVRLKTFEDVNEVINALLYGKEYPIAI